MSRSNYPFVEKNKKAEQTEKEKEIENLRKSLAVLGGNSLTNEIFKVMPNGTVMQYQGNTGFGEDGQLQPHMPTNMVQTQRGPAMLHEGEDIYSNGRETQVIPAEKSVPQSQLRQVEEERNMPGFREGGRYSYPGVSPKGYSPLAMRGQRQLQQLEQRRNVPGFQKGGTYVSQERETQRGVPYGPTENVYSGYPTPSNVISYGGQQGEVVNTGNEMQKAEKPQKQGLTVGPQYTGTRDDTPVTPMQVPDTPNLQVAPEPTITRDDTPVAPMQVPDMIKKGEGFAEPTTEEPATTQFDSYLGRGLARQEQIAAGVSPAGEEQIARERSRISGEEKAARLGLAQTASQLGMTPREYLTEQAMQARQIGAEEAQVIGGLREQQAQQAFQAAQALPGQAESAARYEFMKQKYGDQEAQRMADDAKVLSFESWKQKYPDANEQDYRQARRFDDQEYKAGQLELQGLQQSMGQGAWDAMISDINSGVPLETIRTRDYDGDGKPDNPNLSEDAYNSIGEQYRLGLRAARQTVQSREAEMGAAAWDRLINDVNTGVPLETIRTKDYNGDGQPDVPNFSQPEYDSIRDAGPLGIRGYERTLQGVQLAIEAGNYDVAENALNALFEGTGIQVDFSKMETEEARADYAAGMGEIARTVSDFDTFEEAKPVLEGLGVYDLLGLEEGDEASLERIWNDMKQNTDVYHEIREQFSPEAVNAIYPDLTYEEGIKNLVNLSLTGGMTIDDDGNVTIDPDLIPGGTDDGGPGEVASPPQRNGGNSNRDEVEYGGYYVGDGGKVYVKGGNPDGSDKMIEYNNDPWSEESQKVLTEAPDSELGKLIKQKRVSALEDDPNQIMNITSIYDPVYQEVIRSGKIGNEEVVQTSSDEFNVVRADEDQGGSYTLEFENIPPDAKWISVDGILYKVETYIQPEVTWSDRGGRKYRIVNTITGDGALFDARDNADTTTIKQWFQTANGQAYNMSQGA